MTGVQTCALPISEEVLRANNSLSRILFNSYDGLDSGLVGVNVCRETPQSPNSKVKLKVKQLQSIENHAMSGQSFRTSRISIDIIASTALKDTVNMK